MRQSADGPLLTARKDGPAYGISIGSRRWQLASRELEQVFRIGTIHPLPWADGRVAGLVATETGPVTLMNAEDDGRPPTTQDLGLVIHTPRGRLALCIDRLEPGAAPCDGQGLGEHLDGLACDFSGAAPLVTAVSPPPNPTAQFLRVRSAGVELALPATEVHRVWRHTGTSRSRRSQEASWRVSLEGELLAADSLAGSLGLADVAEDEAWCLQLEPAGSRRALLVGEVLGLFAADIADLRQLDCAGKTETWLMRHDAPPLEIWTRGRMKESGSPRPGSVSQATVPRPLLTLGAGPWKIALPDGLSPRVSGAMDFTELTPRRGRGMLPVFDLDRLLGLGMEEAGPRYGVELGQGRRRCVLACRNLELLTPPSWQGLPMLPPPLPRLLAALHLTPDECIFLLGEEIATRRPLPRRFASACKAAFLGWLPAHSPSTSESSSCSTI